jgi:Ser/Thr protein kinase RdoA (MazF antagonist)
MVFSPAAYGWLGHHTGIPASALVVKRMRGSTSSSVYAVRAKSETAPRFVLRVLDNATWLAEEPDLAAHEAAALTEAEHAGLRAPRLVAYASADAGFGAPVLLMSFLAGRVELRPGNVDAWLAALAVELARIHQHGATNLAWRWRSWVRRDALGVPAWSTQPAAWKAAIDFWQRGEPAFDTVFIHRDFHPANVLWDGKTISGVVDWVNACRGPAGADVAHMRTNLTQMCGADLAARFLSLYCASNPAFRYDPYWDVDSLLDMCAGPPAFYEPWQTFGLARISADVLRQRIETHLATVLAA